MQSRNNNANSVQPVSNAVAVSVDHQHQPQVLVVDDERMNRSMLCRILKHSGIGTNEAASGREAIDMLKSQSFSMVLLDISMPGMDGFETLAEIRTFASESVLPVIIVTAASDRSDVLRAFSSGANDYLTKPIDADTTAARVNAQLKLVAARAELRASRNQLDQK